MDLKARLQKFSKCEQVESAIASNDGRLLIADDDPDQLSLLESIFKAEYAVTLCISGKDALTALSCNFHVALLDIKMEDISGLDVATEIWKSQPETQIIFNTGYAGDYPDREIIGKYHVFAYVKKTDDKEILKAHVKSAVEHSQLIGKYKELNETLAEKVRRKVEKIREKDAQLLQAAKMASLGELAAGIAHQNNNSTTYIETSRDSLIKLIPKKDRLLNQLLASGIEPDDKTHLIDLGEKIAVHYSLHPLQNSDDIEEASESLASELRKKGIKNPDLLAEGILGLHLDDVLAGHWESEFNRLIHFAVSGQIFIIDLLNAYRAVAAHLRNIGAGTRRLYQTAQSLKTFASKGQRLRMDVDIHEGIDNTIELVSTNKCMKCVKITKAYDAPKIDCNPGILQQVWQNLLLNAGQAMENGGEIKIDTYQKDEKNIGVKFSDTGLGIPEQYRSKIFDPYFTTKDRSKGMGLGLNMSYRIIELHGGTIKVQSKVGEGTEFEIILPINPRPHGRGLIPKG